MLITTNLEEIEEIELEDYPITPLKPIVSADNKQTKEEKQLDSRIEKLLVDMMINYSLSNYEYN